MTREARIRFAGKARKQKAPLANQQGYGVITVYGHRLLSLYRKKTLARGRVPSQGYIIVLQIPWGEFREAEEGQSP